MLNRLLLCMIQHTRNEMIKEKTSRRENSLTLTSTTPNLTPSLGLGVFLFPFNAERTGLPSPFLITGVVLTPLFISLSLSLSLSLKDFEVHKRFQLGLYTLSDCGLLSMCVSENG